MSPFLFFISLSAFNMGLLNSKSKFFVPAFSPTIFNLGIILVLLSSFYLFDMTISSLAYAVVFGSILQFLYQLPYIYTNNLSYRVSFSNIFNTKTKKFLYVVGPQVLGLGIYNINILINTQFASFMEDGAITYLYLSERLLEFPLGVFAVSIAVTSLTKFSEFSSKKQIEKISDYLNERMRFLFYLLIPCSIIFIFWGLDICKILFERGEFLSIDSHNTSKALLAYSSGLIFIGGVRLYTQVFFANKNTKTPFKLSIYNLFWNIIFCYLFAFKLDLGFVGLALASSASSLVLFFSLFYNLASENINLRLTSLLGYLLKIIVLCIITLFLIDLLFNLFPGVLLNDYVIFAKIIIFILFYIFFSYIFKISELYLIRQ
tara:strand:+ start:1166 stop:2290 length:1125 start_codon:yes stop_codon:yes gene_type:complete